MKRDGRVDTCALRLWPWIQQCSALAGRGREKQADAVDALLAASDAGEYQFTTDLLAQFGVNASLCPACFYRFAERGGAVRTPTGKICENCATAKALRRKMRP